MKVKDLIRNLMDKDPNDDVQLKLEVELKSNNNRVAPPVKGEADVYKVLPGNTPVLLYAKLHVEVESTVLVW